MNSSEAIGNVNRWIAKKLHSVSMSRIVYSATLYGRYFTSSATVIEFNIIQSTRIATGNLNPKTTIAEKTTFLNYSITKNPC